MTFVAVPAESLPKRARRGREFDSDSANALLSIVSTAGQTASDGTDYTELTDARKAASKARRLLLHVVENADTVKSRVWGAGENNSAPFRWAVYLAEPKPEKPEKAKKAK